MKKEEIVYLERPGPENTAVVIRAVAAYIIRSGLESVVVASTTGSTAIEVAKALHGKATLVVVTHHTGFSKEGVQHFDPEKRKALELQGVKILTQSHVLSGVERSISRRFGGISRVEAIAEALRSLLGHGLKVCVEIAIMAADAGAIPTADVIAIGGTGSGADTAVVIRPAHMNNFFDARIRELIIMPRGPDA
ncbi:MAG TPA: pyruvate kinase alpha/beta domain-containing protein [Candidatus Bathyarchaeia archaeon]|nr:pyruvate kinase alpha/beta domain-containing protein [Candidatus Bathyarchaeia archaeon]